MIGQCKLRISGLKNGYTLSPKYYFSLVIYLFIYLFICVYIREAHVSTDVGQTQTLVCDTTNDLTRL